MLTPNRSGWATAMRFLRRCGATSGYSRDNIFVILRESGGFNLNSSETSAPSLLESSICEIIQVFPRSIFRRRSIRATKKPQVPDEFNRVWYT
jgi:hypothetical protein